MSAKSPSVIQVKWFRGFTSLLREDDPTQSIGRVMGSAHTHKCLHTGRNPVFCRMINKFNQLRGRSGRRFESQERRFWAKILKLFAF